MVFVGHLDTMKVFDRACRRAALPVSGANSRFGAVYASGQVVSALGLLLTPSPDLADLLPSSSSPKPSSPRPAADESPFATRQRLYAALPLPLGATSACEWLEVILTERFEPEAVRAKLQVRTGGGGAAWLACRVGSWLAF